MNGGQARPMASYRLLREWDEIEAHPLEYYEDGYLQRPACLDRRPIPVAEAA